MQEERNRYRGALVGLAVGDAVGTSVEFRPRGSFEPLTDMVGGGPFRLRAGQWTDDTSMALCLATSLVECGGFDAADQMRRYCDWWSNGYLSSTGRCFDIGNTVASALRRFQQTGEPFSGSTDPGAAGNGSIMRLAPIAIRHHPDEETAAHGAAESSRTTHGAEEAVDACRMLCRMLCAALSGRSKSEVLRAAKGEPGSDRLVAIASGEHLDKAASEIRGTGYVVDCLEAATWCFAGHDTFEDAVLAAANLGDDADTTAAVCGQLAGAHHGLDGIPERWLDRLCWRDEIVALADALRDR